MISQLYAPIRRPNETKGRRKDEMEDGKSGKQKESKKERTVKERKECCVLITVRHRGKFAWFEASAVV
jgi:hypothetical protein